MLPLLDLKHKQLLNILIYLDLMLKCAFLSFCHYFSLFMEPCHSLPNTSLNLFSALLSTNSRSESKGPSFLFNSQGLVEHEATPNMACVSQPSSSTKKGQPQGLLISPMGQQAAARISPWAGTPLKVISQGWEISCCKNNQLYWTLVSDLQDPKLWYPA